MAKTMNYVLCPVCFKNHLETRELTLENPDLKTLDFIQVRDISGGRTKDGKSHGFPKIDAMTLHDAVVSGNYNDTINQVKEQLLKVVQAFYDEGLISRTELNSIK